MFDIRISHPLTHIKEVNAEAMACLLGIARKDPRAAADLFDTTIEIIERLLALDDSSKPKAERIGLIELLMDTIVPIFEPFGGDRYITQAVSAPIEKDFCSPDGQYAQYRQEVCQLNRLVARAFGRLAWIPANAILAFNIAPSVIDALVDLPDPALLRLEDNAGRPLVRLRLTHKILDQCFVLRSRPCIDASLVPWVLLCNLTEQEASALPTIDQALAEVPPLAPPKQGRPRQNPYSKQTGELVRMLGEVGGTIQTASKLLGRDVNNIGLRRLINDARPPQAGFNVASWNASMVMRMISTSITLLALRLLRAGYPYNVAQIAAYHYYRRYLCAGSPVIKVDDYVDRVALPLARSSMRLEYSHTFEAAYLLGDSADANGVSAPHKGLVSQGRLGDARMGLGRRRAQNAPFREGSIARLGGVALQGLL